MNTTEKTDREYMMQALRLASASLYSSYPNPGVGCVIVRDHQVIGQGFHHKAGEPHAEIMALADAGFDAKGADVYVTLEPCSHYGRTPPCAKKLIEMQVKRVVISAGDPNPKVSGRGIAMLRDAGIEVVEHCLEKKGLFLNRAFMKAITGKYPYVTLKTGMSLDAATALADGQSKWITGARSRSKVQQLRALSDVIITGRGTVEADNPGLDVRYDELPAKVKAVVSKDRLRQPVKVVLDSHGRLDPGAYKLFKSGKVIWVTGCDKKHPDAQEEKVNSCTVRWYLPLEKDRIPLESLLKRLGSLSFRRCLIEAGTALTAAFIEKSLFDEVYAFVAPKLLGKGSRPAFASSAPLNLDDCLKLKLHKVKALDDDVMLHYTVK